jgi:hypothetical protein
MLLVLLLGVADFGRVFQAGITIEGAARNGAEAAALERLRNKPPTDPSKLDGYYDNLHAVAGLAACQQARVLPNTAFQASDGTCQGMPAIRACVHDGMDTRCGEAIPGFDASIPAGCAELGAAWTAASAGDIASHAVELRICYRFTTLFNLHVSLPFGQSLNLGDVWLQRTRFFVLDCPPGPVSTC